MVAVAADMLQNTDIAEAKARSREENGRIYGSIRFTFKDGTEMISFAERTGYV